MWFDSLSDLVRVVVMGVCAYAGLVLMLRVSGKRTLAKMNAFDFVVTVAFGSTLATTLLSKDVSLTEALLAFAVLIGLQYAVAWLSLRVKFVEQIVKSEPRLLAYGGRLLHDALRDERVSEEEVHAAVRSAGFPGVEAVDAVVFETNGQLSVIKKAEGYDTRTSLTGVSGFPDAKG